MTTAKLQAQHREACKVVCEPRPGERYRDRLIDWENRKYPSVSISHKNFTVHTLVWEAANGPVPLGFDIHHKDFNKFNFALDNLMLLSRLDHRRIHFGWLRDEAGSWTAKPCSGCSQVVALEQFHKTKAGRFSGLCRPCDYRKNQNYFLTPKGREVQMKAREAWTNKRRKAA